MQTKQSLKLKDLGLCLFYYLEKRNQKSGNFKVV
jgi:hypothetical protein